MSSGEAILTGLESLLLGDAKSVLNSLSMPSPCLPPSPSASADRRKSVGCGHQNLASPKQPRTAGAKSLAFPYLRPNRRKPYVTMPSHQTLGGAHSTTKAPLPVTLKLHSKHTYLRWQCRIAAFTKSVLKLLSLHDRRLMAAKRAHQSLRREKGCRQSPPSKSPCSRHQYHAPQ